MYFVNLNRFLINFNQHKCRQLEAKGTQKNAEGKDQRKGVISAIFKSLKLTKSSHVWLWPLTFQIYLLLVANSIPYVQTTSHVRSHRNVWVFFQQKTIFLFYYYNVRLRIQRFSTNGNTFFLYKNHNYLF